MNVADRDLLPIKTETSSRRRSFLKFGAAAFAGFLARPAWGRRNQTAQNQPAQSPACAPPIPTGPYNGSDCPFSIPWLDKNGSFNQSPQAGAELSNIFHFKGQVARCNNWVGMGTDNKGNRIPFGSPTTDFSFMKGTYFNGRREHEGVFAHI